MAVIRLFSFQAARPGFDEILRTELVPDLLVLAGIQDCYVGRQGPDDAGPRIVATIWDRREAMADALGERLGTFHPEYLDATAAQRLEVMEARITVRGQTVDAGILRVLRGEVHPGELDAYVDDVQRGVELDVAGGHGPAALYLGESGPNAFVTVSAWRDWSDIARATGGDVRNPLATRHPERLAGWDVQLFEIVEI